MLERQNALFDYFYQTFLETIEHLKAKGKIDDGMEDLKAISVRTAEHPQVLFAYALTGATTVYYKLEITVPTRPALFEEISIFENVFFYKNRSTGEYVAARASLAHTDPETGMRYQMFAVSRPSGYNLFYLKESELTSKYKIVSKNRAKDWRQREQQKIPQVEQKTIHLLSGALLPIWKYLKKLQQSGLSIVRTTTDDGTRLVGLNIGANVIGEIRRAFGIWKNSGQTAEEIIKSVSEESEQIELLGDMKIRRTRFQGNRVIEISPSTYEQIQHLRETDLINIIQNSRNCFFLSDDKETACQTLSQVLKMFPPLHLLKTSGEAACEPNKKSLTDNHSPVRLPTIL